LLGHCANVRGEKVNRTMGSKKRDGSKKSNWSKKNRRLERAGGAMEVKMNGDIVGGEMLQQTGLLSTQTCNQQSLHHLNTPQ
jgi:hypothetical protein